MHQHHAKVHIFSNNKNNRDKGSELTIHDRKHSLNLHVSTEFFDRLLGSTPGSYELVRKFVLIVAPYWHRMYLRRHISASQLEQGEGSYRNE